MRVFEVRNAHAAVPVVLQALAAEGATRPSRNGTVLKFRTPVTVVYKEPTERVVFHAVRDANPFFHLMEAVWMLAGRNDVNFVARFASNMRTFSDDGYTLNGAYGHRWRKHFDVDQLVEVVEVLRANPDDRQQVIQMYDVRTDRKPTKDVPCNLVAVPQVNDDGALDLTVFNRSNDIVWGMLGANAVHFSYLQEFLATFIERPVGRYYQVSTNAHLYLDRYASLPLARFDPNPYQDGFRRRPDFRGDVAFAAEWLRRLEEWLRLDNGWGARDTGIPFIDRTVRPMRKAFNAYKNGFHPPNGLGSWQDALDEVEDEAWAQAGREWIHRRLK